MQGCVLVVGILQLVKAVRGKTVKEKPVKLYDIAQEFLCIISFIIWIRAVWNKENGFQCLLRKIYQYVPVNGSNPSKRVKFLFLNSCPDYSFSF